MDVIFFETVVAARSRNGDLLIALFDGSLVLPGPQGCVAILACTPESGRALIEAAGSALISNEL